MSEETAEGQEATEEQAVVEEQPENGQDNVSEEVADKGQPEEGEESKGAAESEVVVTIGEGSPPANDEAPAPEWVKELRKTNRADKRRIRELEDQLNAKASETNPGALGKKPTLEENEYDEEKFDRALSAWYDRKRSLDQAAAQAEAAHNEQQKAWQDDLNAYGKAKTELKVNDFEDAEEVAQEVFNITQQGIVVKGADNPALVIYALGKNPKKAKELSTITDPVKFAFAVAKLETQLKVTQRKAATAPERTINGTGNKSGTVDSTLERLRAEAEKSGDYTKVTQYKMSKRAAKTK